MSSTTTPPPTSTSESTGKQQSKKEYHPTLHVSNLSPKQKDRLEKYLEGHHVDFIDTEQMNPEDLMKPMHHYPKKGEQVVEDYIPHGQMAKTLYNTEKLHEEITDMDEGDTTGGDM